MADVKLKELVINECSSVPSTFEPNQLYLTPDTTEEDIANALKQAKEYTDSREQDVRKDFMESDTALQTQITGLSDALDDEKGKIVDIESKVPTTASSSNLLTTATDLLNATQDVRSDFAEADVELQTQINGQATAISDLSDDVMANMGEIADIKEQIKNFDALPSQTGNAGKYLTTNGTMASWGDVNLSSCANIDASNFTKTGKSNIASCGMPSNRYIDLTLGASNSSYIAPANGYFSISKISTGTNQSVNLINGTTNVRSSVFCDNGSYGYVNIPVKKGDKVFVVYNMGGATEFYRFIYAEGEV